MPDIKMPYCVIEKQMRDNYLALFQELKDAAESRTFYDWYEENEFLVEQSITELETVDIEHA